MYDGGLFWLRSTLELKLREQEFVELIRCGKAVEAVFHSRKYFSVVDLRVHAEIPQLMALLAFTPETGVLPYKVRYLPNPLLITAVPLLLFYVVVSLDTGTKFDRIVMFGVLIGYSH